MQPEAPKDEWKIKKEISLGDLVAFVASAIAVIYAYSTLDSRVKVLEENRVSQQRTDQRQDEEHIRYQVRIDTTLSQINAKLDRLVERR